MATTGTQRNPELTFRGNSSATRHGWLRLTPAYGRRLVEDLIDEHQPTRVLDPFSGSSTTPLAAAYKGVEATGVELNPFLVWLGSLKLRKITKPAIRRARAALERVLKHREDPAQPPPLFNIDRWWTPDVLAWLCLTKGAIDAETGLSKSLLTVAFCRTLIELSSASFNHVSMSFGKAVTPADLETHAAEAFIENAESVLLSAEARPVAHAHVVHGDARDIGDFLERKYDMVITSPPYPNRMSYIRELRPYMYWTGHLVEARDAGELDWKAIGGTWGVATSRLSDWHEQADAPDADLKKVVRRIAGASEKNGALMAAYVQKYFQDTERHLRGLKQVTSRGATIHYVVGNSQFYGAMVPTQDLLANLMKKVGFSDVGVTRIRKRNSKKRLFEYRVSATQG